MKKLFAIFSTACILAACAKEIQNTEENSNLEENLSAKTELVLYASIPQMEAETKADAVGTFAWSDGDAIAIPIDGGYVDFVYDSGKGAFTYSVTGSETFVDGTAYYPANSKPSGSYSTEFASPAAAKAGFKMEAPFTVGATNLSFTHKSALVKLNFTNVPNSATGVRVKAGETVVATVALSSPAANVEVYVPITPDGSQKYSFALMQNAVELKEVSKSNATLTAGKYYTSKSIDFAITNLYLLGGATDTGWSLASMKPLTKSGSVFTIKANLTAGASGTNEVFRFPMQPDTDKWWPCLVKGDTDGTLRIGDNDGDQGSQFYVAQDGNYEISIDVSSMTYTITRKGDKIENPLEIEHLYIIGEATEYDWTFTSPEFVSDGNGNWTLENVNLKASQRFRFPLQKDWFPALMPGTTDGSVVLAYGDGTHFSVPKDGTYDIVINSDYKTISITLKEAAIWYVIGNVYGTNPSITPWSKDDAVPMVESSPGIWTVTVNITGDFKLEKHTSYSPLWFFGNLGLWADGALGGTGIFYGLLSNGVNIGINPTGKYSLQLEPANASYSNLLTGDRIGDLD